jgi:hypothetical protein
MGNQCSCETDGAEIPADLLSDTMSEPEHSEPLLWVREKMANARGLPLLLPVVSPVTTPPDEPPGSGSLEVPLLVRRGAAAPRAPKPYLAAAGREHSRAMGHWGKLKLAKHSSAAAATWGKLKVSAHGSIRAAQSEDGHACPIQHQRQCLFHYSTRQKGDKPWWS